MDLQTNPGISPKKPEVAQANEKGYEAQGYALAQVVIAGTISAAKQLQNACVTAFGYSIEARTACVNALKKWTKECRENVKNSGNLSNMEKASLNKIAGSATTRTSEFSKIMEAMNSGMTMETLAQKHGIEDPENVSFHVIVADARDFLASAASGETRGKKSDPLNVKLDKWLASQLRATPLCADEISMIRADLKDYLPKADETQAAANQVTYAGKAVTLKSPVKEKTPRTKPAQAVVAPEVQHLPAVTQRRRKTDRPQIKH